MSSAVDPQPQNKVGIHALPPDALDDVVRFFSERPRDVEWFRHIRTSHLATLSRDIGPLTRSAQRCISTLSLTVGSDADCDIARDVLRVLGPGCVELHLIANAAPPAASAWLAAYTRWAVNIRSMSLTLGPDSPDPNALLAPVGATLCTFRVDADPRIAGALYNAAAQHCVALRTLDLHVAFHNARGLRALFTASGRTLTELTLTIRDALLVDAIDAEPLDLRSIAALCPHLNALTLHGDLRAARSDAEMLVRLIGPQLRRLAFPFAGASTAFLHSLAASCPNADIETGMTPPAQRLDDFLHGERADPTPTMSIIGPRLVALQIRAGFRRNAELATAAVAAQNLRSLGITDCGRDAAALLSDLFAMRRSNLTELRLAFATPRVSYPLACVVDALTVVARSSGALTFFEFSGPLLPAGAFDGIAAANKGIEHAVVRMRSGPRTPDDDEVRRLDKVECVLSAIRAFATCASLRFLTVEDWSVNPWTEISIPEPILRACRSLSDRRICISVDGRLYLK